MQTLRFHFLIYLLSFLFATPMLAQRLDHVQGEILIKLYAENNPHELIQKHQRFNGLPTDIRLGKKISNPMNIYSVTFDWRKISEQQMLDALWRDPAVEIAQFNHFIETRSTTPDDPQFDQQWQYINTGQSGGAAGADIDADLAWDITTGGVTADGDTIVVCIIDGGFEIDHEDLQDNIWYNYAEIPNNGIDDDNNGFVDDYRGWNTANDNDNVTQGNAVWHGTPVAGIVGAKGNNGIGVAGMSWDVKMMLISGGTGVESEVLEAYSYPLTFRKRYNETDGEEGAFVVATNASWGVDGGQPSNAPLWCAFYDTLGVHGILNAGATTNANADVDAIGDLPTTCPSDYLLSITNLNHNDEKNVPAGWGAVHVDLGAFGEGTWTTASNNSYSGFGGTSGATPHVAGAIGLLYSAPCSNIASLAKSDPGAAALLIREYILDGVVPNASIQDITVTGGRLNIHNSMQLLMEDCGPCPAPSGLATTGLTDTEATLNWNNTDNSISDTLRWRQVGAADWTIVDDATSPYPLSMLIACTDYEFQVISHCDTINSEYSAIYTFKTDGCCEAPSDLAISNITETSAAASWSSILAAQSYNIRIRPIGTADWEESNTTDTDFNFSDLAGCTEYEVQIQTVCASETTEYSASTTFKTQGCGACFDLSYCEPPQLDAGSEWIEAVSINTLQNVSGNNSGYGDFSGGNTTDLATNNPYDITLTPGFSGQQYEEYFKVWIDFNQDGDFEDAGEAVYESTATQAAVTGSINIPGDAALGITRMRIIMSYDELPSSACTVSSDYGEIEDYCVNIVEGTAPCNIPANLDTMSVETTIVNLNWESTSANSYKIRYKLSSESNWTELTSNTNTLAIENLQECSEYEAQIKSVCSEEESEYSASLVFTTDCLVNTNDLNKEVTHLKIYPNPFSDKVRVDFSFTDRKDEVEIQLVNQFGQSIQSQQLTNISKETQRVIFNGDKLPAGVYFIKIQTSDGKYLARKMMKMD